MRRVLIVVSFSFVFSLTLVACPEGDEEAVPAAAPPEAPPGPDDLGESGDEALDRARALAKAVGGGLKTRLVAAMGEGGPAAAITVCADEAQNITRQAVGEGEAAGRASTKLRNLDNAGPAWVRAWLASQGERAADAAPLGRIEDGRARVIVPIGVDGVCLNCHGAADGLSPEVIAVLAERYPTDQATGYAEGDLRGALWAEVPAN